MTHKRDPLSIFGVIDRSVAQVGGWAAASAATGKHEKRLRDACNPYAEGRHAGDLPYSAIRALVMAGATAPLDDLAHLAGAQLLPVVTAAPVVNMHSGIVRLVKEAGEAAAIIDRLADDGGHSPNEIADITRELIDVSAIVTAMLVQVQKLKAGG